MRIRVQFDGEKIGDIWVGDDGKLQFDGDESVTKPIATRYLQNLVEIEGQREVTAEDILGSMLDHLQGRMAAVKVADNATTEAPKGGDRGKATTAR